MLKGLATVLLQIYWFICSKTIIVYIVLGLNVTSSANVWRRKKRKEGKETTFS